MKYTVSIAIDGRIDIEVDGVDNVHEAKEEAESLFADANIGDVECVGYHAVNATDENGELFDY